MYAQCLHCGPTISHLGPPDQMVDLPQPGIKSCGVVTTQQLEMLTTNELIIQSTSSSEKGKT